MDDQKVSDVTLEQLLTNDNQYWSIRFEVAEDAKNVGGLTLFGKKFGNHEQDIMIRTFYEKAEAERVGNDTTRIRADEEP